MNIKQITILTAADGTFVADVNLTGEIYAIGLTLGTLSTPDIALTDTKTAEAIWSKAGIAASGYWQPKRKVQGVTAADLAAAAGPPAVDNVYAPPVVLGQLHVAVSGAGDTLTGTLYVAYKG